MTTNAYRSPPAWGQRLAFALLLMLAGGALALWALGQWEAGARLLGFQRAQSMAVVAAAPAPPVVAPVAVAAVNPVEAARIGELEARLDAVEQATQRVEGSAGRADALLIAFAARRAIDRGVALGYLETLLVERFGARHEADVATVISASHQPVRLDQLVERYDGLGDALRSADPGEGWWEATKRELGGLVTIRRADAPSPRPTARYDRARAALASGKVDVALAETLRLPGAARAGPWVEDARRYIRAHRSLDALESAALLGGGRPDAPVAAAQPDEAGRPVQGAESR